MKKTSNSGIIWGVLAFLGIAFLISESDKSKKTIKKNTIKKPLNPVKPKRKENFDFKVKTPSELEEGRSSAYPYLA